MAVYKLANICYSIRGNSSFQKKHLKTNVKKNHYVALHYGKTYKVNRLNNDYNFFVSDSFYKENQLVQRYDTILISTSETLEDLGHSYLYDREDLGLLGGEQILLKANEDIVNKEYLYYLTKQLKPNFRKYATGMKVYRFKIDDFNHINVNIPSMFEQEKIIEIIKPIENMILNLENIKNNALRLVDSLPVKSTNKYIKFKSIQTGRHNADFEDSKGHYDFYTCGMKIRKCNNYSFDGKYIILSGNASLYTWWIDGKFDLYQRVYALETNKDFFTSYHSVRNAMRKLRDESSGSVIKYITLNDIKRIELLDNSYESELSKIYKIISSTERILEDLDNIKNSMINLLIK